MGIITITDFWIQNLFGKLFFQFDRGRSQSRGRSQFRRTRSQSRGRSRTRRAPVASRSRSRSRSSLVRHRRSSSRLRSRSRSRGRSTTRENTGRIFQGAPNARGISRLGGHEPRRSVVNRVRSLVRNRVGRIPTGIDSLVWGAYRVDHIVNGTDLIVKEKPDTYAAVRHISLPATSAGLRPRAKRYVFTIDREWRPNNVFGYLKAILTSDSSVGFERRVRTNDQSLTWSVKDLPDGFTQAINIPEDIGKAWATLGNYLAIVVVITGKSRDAVDDNISFVVKSSLEYTCDSKPVV